MLLGCGKVERWEELEHGLGESWMCGAGVGQVLLQCRAAGWQPLGLLM